MPVSVKENWSGRSYSQRTMTARREFTVSGVVDDLQAISAVPELARNVSFPQDARLLSEGAEVTRWEGPRFAVVTADFSIPQSGSGSEHEPPPETNKLDEPPRISWQQSESSEPVDKDADGYPILYSNWQPVDPPVSRIACNERFTVKVWESTYDRAKANTYKGKTNSDTVKLWGWGDAQPDTLLMVSCLPASELRPDDTPVEIVYTFEVDELLLHKWRLLDQGVVGISAISAGGDPQTKPIWDASSKEVTQPVLLDGTGIPKNTAYTIEGTAGVSRVGLAGVEVEVGNDAVWLRYKKYKSMPFSGLGVF